MKKSWLAALVIVSASAAADDSLQLAVSEAGVTAGENSYTCLAQLRAALEDESKETQVVVDATTPAGDYEAMKVADALKSMGFASVQLNIKKGGSWSLKPPVQSGSELVSCKAKKGGKP